MRTAAFAPAPLRLLHSCHPCLAPPPRLYPRAHARRDGAVRRTAVPGGATVAANAGGGGDASRRLARVRTRVFLTMLFGYATYYVCRSTFVFSAPSMQHALGLTITDVGVITSAFPAVYGVAKLFGGVIADVNSPRVVLAGGLLAVAAVNGAFALGTGSVIYFASLWALLGLVSSVGFPACAKLLSVWYSAAERGRAWGLLNISLNIGGLVSPVLIGGLASSVGWRAGVAVPAALAAVVAAVTYLSIADSPVATGLVAATPAQVKAATVAAAESEARGNGVMARLEGAVEAFRRQLFEGVLTVRPVWNLAFAYFCVYIVRQGLTYVVGGVDLGI
jgi:MFS transporter, OPA family, sugar phosphate sensor protein UhpC